jgi:DNA end-binding protein Ku
LTFGLVNIPVRLHSAVQAKERVSFRLLHKTDLSPIRYERVCQKEGEAVDWKDIVKGYEYTKGKFVVLTDDDFKAAAIESSKTIEIMDFVKSDEIDARYFETPYYVVPAKGGEKAYALLREAVKRTGMVGIGKITMRSNSLHLAGVKAVGEALVLEIMRFEEELVDLSDLTLPRDTNVRPQELQMAEQLVANLSQPFDPSKYVDDYRANLMKIIRAKMKGKKLDVPEPEERESTQVVDLMARLQESLEMGKKQKAGPPAPVSGRKSHAARIGCSNRSTTESACSDSRRTMTSRSSAEMASTKRGNFPRSSTRFARCTNAPSGHSSSMVRSSRCATVRRRAFKRFNVACTSPIAARLHRTARDRPLL